MGNLGRNLLNSPDNFIDSLSRTIHDFCKVFLRPTPDSRYDQAAGFLLVLGSDSYYLPRLTSRSLI
jgi:hypothetical protein